MERERRKFLGGMPLFGGLKEATLEFLMSQAQIREVPAGEFLFREDEPAESMGVLEDGEVVILRRWQSRYYKLNTLGRGDCIGEMSLLDMSPRSASVYTLKPCQLIQFSYPVFYNLRKWDLEQFTLLNLNMAREVCRRLRSADKVIFTSRVSEDPNFLLFNL